MGDTSYDLVIIGSGPAGYVAAIRAAQLGMKVAIIEKDASLGGTCLNIGCIPSKALLHSSEHYYHAKSALVHGIKYDALAFDLGMMMHHKEQVVKKLVRGVSALMKKHAIAVIHGSASLKSPSEVAVVHKGTTVSVHASYILLASGSVPQHIPSCPVDSENIVTSTEMLSLTEVPRRLLVIGGGAIGLELGSVWQRLGAQVTVCEMQPEILPALDSKVGRTLRRALEAQGMHFMCSAAIQSVSTKKGCTATITDAKGATHSIECDKILVAVGRKPYTEGLGLQEVGVKVNARGFVEVDARYCSNIKSIYAIGDVIPGPMLAHKGEEEGVAVAEILNGRAGHVNYATIPNIVYTSPEVATVGNTEAELKSKNIKYKVGRFPFSANGRAIVMDAGVGFVRILAHEQNDSVLGAEIVGPWASDLIAEVVMLMEFGGSAEDMARTVHGHPTLTEAVREAALDVDGRALHVV